MTKDRRPAFSLQVDRVDLRGDLTPRYEGEDDPKDKRPAVETTSPLAPWSGPTALVFLILIAIVLGIWTGLNRGTPAPPPSPVPFTTEVEAGLPSRAKYDPVTGTAALDILAEHCLAGSFQTCNTLVMETAPTPRSPYKRLAAIAAYDILND